MRAWRKRSAERLFEHPLLTLERQRLENGAAERDVLVLQAPDWVNVIPLGTDDRVVLVRQWRYGVAAATLEIPGGVVEPGEGHRAAAERELLEETGYRARRWQRLGDVEPNPAILANRCSTWLATGLERYGEPVGDGEEELEVELVPLAEIPQLVRDGAIRHALVVAAFYLLGATP